MKAILTAIAVAASVCGTAAASSISDNQAAAQFTNVTLQDLYAANDEPASSEEVQFTEFITVRDVDVKELEPQIFTAVEQMPSFPGGESALMQFLAEHIHYPASAVENNIQGRVTVQFVVEKDGSIGRVKVARGADPDLDKEAVRVVKTLPKFSPGKNNGQPVAVWYTLPINFRLTGK